MVTLPTPEALAFRMRGSQRPALQTDIDAIRADRVAIVNVCEELIKREQSLAFPSGHYQRALDEVLALLCPAAPKENA